MSFSGDGGEMRWLRLAATQGDAAAQFRLAIAYSFGRGVPEDDAEAARWYRLSAEQGYAAAQYHLGRLHMREVVALDRTPCRRICGSTSRQRRVPRRRLQGVVMR